MCRGMLKSFGLGQESILNEFVDVRETVLNPSFKPMGQDRRRDSDHQAARGGDERSVDTLGKHFCLVTAGGKMAVA